MIALFPEIKTERGRQNKALRDSRQSARSENASAGSCQKVPRLEWLVAAPPSLCRALRCESRGPWARPLGNLPPEARERLARVRRELERRRRLAERAAAWELGLLLRAPKPERPA